MCGIVGAVSFSKPVFDQATIKRASDHLKHRGPDHAAELLFQSGEAQVVFAHRRLSVIDLSALGNQPMTSATGRTTIVFNGEIYNYREIQKELTQSGMSFQTQSDTEVILNAVEKWGCNKALQKLDGMFAFAIFDRANDRLHLARDRFGKKPLYYCIAGQQLIFSSDVRSFEAIPGIDLQIDIASLGYYFSELSTPLEHTIWRQVKKLRPATFLTFSKEGVEEHATYWNLQYTEDCKQSDEEIVETISILLQGAIRKRLVADVNVSALLSGGIDSSLVVAKMSSLLNSPVNTYSVGFEEATFNELPYARYVAEKFKTNHTEIVLNPNSVLDHRALIYEFGEPFADSSMVPTYLISREIARREKVVLGGDGGDELFAGYSSYYFASKLDQVKSLRVFHPVAKLFNRFYSSYRVDLLQKLLQQANRPSYELLDRGFGFSCNELQVLFPEPEFYEAANREHKMIWETFGGESSHSLIKLLSSSLRTRLVNDYLVKVDRASMFASLEMRSPFLDKDLAEFAATLTPNQLLRKAGTKSILKTLASRYFDPSFVHRKKMGFGVPLGDWFRGVLKNEVKEVILGGKQSIIKLNYSFIEKLIIEHTSGLQDHTHRIWAMYVFHIWANRR